MAVSETEQHSLAAGLRASLKRRTGWPIAAATLLMSLLPLPTQAAGGRLLATGGVMQFEGAGGGGLVPWALIAGYGTRDEVGGSVFATVIDTGDFFLRSAGGAVGLYDRLELSFARQHFDLGDTVPGQAIEQNILGAKLKLWGDAVYDQDRPWPQLAAGLQYKRTLDFAVPALLGAEDPDGVDVYLAATKVYLGGAWGRNLLVNVATRATRANQFGILGFGGDREHGYSPQFEGSLAVFVSDRFIVGAEYRTRPDNLQSFDEENGFDLFAAWLPHKQLALTAAYVDLGRIANRADQDAYYFSLQLSF